jgi:hypothetical protein
MSHISHKKAQLFLEGLHSNVTSQTFEMLQGLIEVLESKNDPDPAEIRLVDSIYSFVEKLNILESNISNYSKKNSEDAGSKLNSLYENISYNGSIYRD